MSTYTSYGFDFDGKSAYHASLYDTWTTTIATTVVVDRTIEDATAGEGDGNDDDDMDAVVVPGSEGDGDDEFVSGDNIDV